MEPSESQNPASEYNPIHCVPPVDIILHIPEPYCECMPRLERHPKTGEDIFVHRFILEEYH